MISQKSILTYIEKNEGSTLLIDFIDFENLENFLRSVAPTLNDFTSDDPSMIMVRDYSGKRVREGTYYPLNKNILPTLIAQNRIIATELDSYIVGYEIDMNGINEDLFLDAASPSKVQLVIAPSKNRAASNVVLSNVIVDELVIRDVGQGNWNELYNSDDLKVVFDIGAEWPKNKSQVNNLVNSRIGKIGNDRPSLVISHWDTDHYHCLSAFTQTQITYFSNILFRDKLPTVTSQKAYHKIINNVNNYYPIAPDPKPSIRPFDVLSVFSKNNNITLFNSAINSNRNREGLSIVVDNSTYSAVLTGDLYYRQVSDHIYPQITHRSDNYLVVPHHGGRSGPYVMNLNNTTPREAIISVGTKPHVQPTYVKSLVQSGFQIRRTNQLGKDYSINL